MLEGGLCVLGYYSRLPYLVEMSGLTQYSLARLRVEERGQIGHEKSPDAEWLTENRIHLIISNDVPPVVPAATGRPYNVMYFGRLAKAVIWIYDDEVMDRLRGRPGVWFVPIEELVGLAERVIERSTPAEGGRLRRELDRYYFRHAGERARGMAQRLDRAVGRSRARPLDGAASG
jgi:hypothetical protein